MAPVIAWTIAATSKPEWEPTLVRPDSAPPADPRLNELGDAELVAACVSDRPGAFDVVVARHQRVVYQLCYRFVGNHEDASDLSQDVFLRAYRGLRNFRGHAPSIGWPEPPAYGGA